MILLYVCVLDTIYGLVTKKIAIGNLRKIIVTLYYNLWSYDYLPYISGGYFLGNETIYGIKNTHIQQNRTDQLCG
jgi:hypothetical protein